MAPGLPRILCGAQQLRQAVLHCLQFAIGAVERDDPAAAPEANRKPSGSKRPGRQASCRFQSATPARASCILSAPSIPLLPAQPGGETAGLGLSLCATILRDQNGRASAVNLEPRGAAIILELQAA